MRDNKTKAYQVIHHRFHFWPPGVGIWTVNSSGVGSVALTVEFESHRRGWSQNFPDFLFLSDWRSVKAWQTREPPQLNAN